MAQTRQIMGMPVTVDIRDVAEDNKIFGEIFAYFEYVDGKFSTYKENSEISRINRDELKLTEEFSADMRIVLELSEQTRLETGGYFDIKNPVGILDPSGLVKGWAIYNAAKMLDQAGHKHYYIEAGGDIQVHSAENDEAWTVGIRNPFKREEIVKILAVRNQGVATSGTYIRGEHIYTPQIANGNVLTAAHKGSLLSPAKPADQIVSLTVIGPNIYEADRFATAAFAMGPQGIIFLENLAGFEAYLINKDGVATQTSGLAKYLKPSDA